MSFQKIILGLLSLLPIQSMDDITSQLTPKNGLYLVIGAAISYHIKSEYEKLLEKGLKEKILGYDNDQNNPINFLMLGNIYYDPGKRLNKAIKYYTMTIKQDPKHTYKPSSINNSDKEPHDLKSTDKCSSNKKVVTKARSEEGVWYDSHPGGVYDLRGKVYCELKNYDAAIDDFKNALNLDPQNLTYKKHIKETNALIAKESTDIYSNNGFIY